MLTPRQMQVLRWLDENPSSSSSWTVDGRPLRSREPFDKTNVMVVSGKQGSIHIAKADVRAIGDYIVGCPTLDKIFGPNERGKAALAELKD